MTGTSMDGLDAALVRLTGRGLNLRPRFLAGASRSLGSLAQPLRSIAAGCVPSTGLIPELAHQLALLHIRVIRGLLRRAAVAPSDLALIAVHGQTLFHRPPLSWQLVNPMPIAQALGCPVVFDLRGADLACGGEGAPITPMADHLLFRPRSPRNPRNHPGNRPRKTRVVVNFGGFINYTVLPSAPIPSASRALQGRMAFPAITGGDLCACNQLLDAIARQCFHAPFDRGGRRAWAGRVDDQACAALMRQLQRQARSRRSLGTGDETLTWLAAHQRTLTPNDLARTACAAIARTLVDTLVTAGAGNACELIAAGGGARNRALMAEIRAHLPAASVLTVSDDLGVPLQFREAIAMAVLGALAQDRVPITLPQITGLRRPAPLAGAWVLP
jgi:1,6-anhydro-N-acetylmuramate kinase